MNIFSGHVVKGGLGVAIGGGLLIYMLRSEVKAVFAIKGQH